MQGIQPLHQTYCPNISPEVLNITSTVFKVMAVATVIFAIILESTWLLLGSAIATAISFAILSIEADPGPLPSPRPKGHDYVEKQRPGPVDDPAKFAPPPPPPLGDLANNGGRPLGVPPPPLGPPPFIGDNPFAVAPRQRVERPAPRPAQRMDSETLLGELQATLLRKQQARQQEFQHLRSPSAPDLQRLAPKMDALPDPRKKLNFSTLPTSGGGGHMSELERRVRARKPVSPLPEIPAFTPAKPPQAKKAVEEPKPRTKQAATAQKVAVFAPPPGFGKDLFAAIAKRKPKESPAKLSRNHSSPHLGKLAAGQPARTVGRLKLALGGSLLDAIRANKKSTPSPARPALPQQDLQATDDSAVTVAKVPLGKVPTPPPYLPPPARELLSSGHRRSHSLTEVDGLDLADEPEVEAVEDEGPQFPPAAFQTPAVARTLSSVWTPGTIGAVTGRRTAILGSTSSLAEPPSPMSDDDAPLVRQVTFEKEETAEVPVEQQASADFADPVRLNALDLATPAHLPVKKLFGTGNKLLTTGRGALRRVEVEEEAPPAASQASQKTQEKEWDGEDESSSDESDAPNVPWPVRQAQVAKLFGPLLTPAPGKGKPRPGDKKPPE